MTAAQSAPSEELPAEGLGAHDPETEAAPTTVQRLAHAASTWTFLFLIALVVFFWIWSPTAFGTVDNLRNIALDTSILLIIAVGATYVIITAGIDLSVGAILVFSGIVSARVMEALGSGTGSVVIGFVAGLGAGTAWGMLNGFLVAYARIPAFIATLGTFSAATGLGLIITDGIDARDVPTGLVQNVGNADLFGQIPYLVIVAIVVAIVAAIMLSRTTFGRYTYAVGSNMEAARRVGINVEWHLVKVYAFAGLVAGLAGFLSLARFATTTIGGHATDNFQAITAVVLGGTSLFGGIGTIAGTVIGAFIPTVLNNGLVIVGVIPFWQQVAVGAILVTAVYFDQWRRSKYRN
jgi:ribose transport system permease protein